MPASSETTSPPATSTGVFISFEGVEGSGKSTQIGRLEERLKQIGWTVLRLREPGGSPLGEGIRRLLLHACEGEGMCAEAELLLFAASRAQLVRTVIEPALAQGQAVLCDRFFDSTTVYQGAGRRLPPEAVASINRFAVGATIPHATAILDLDPEHGLQRVLGRSLGGLDRMEREQAEFHHRVRQGYRRLAETTPERCFLVDATRPAADIQSQLWDELCRRLPRLAH